MKITFCFLLLFFLSCENMTTIPLVPTDLTPPMLISVSCMNDKTVVITSDEPIYFMDESYYSREGLQINSVNKNNNSLEVKLENSMIPGFEYCSEFRIEDSTGNSLSFIANYYGFNPSLPKIIINEFIVKGTNTNPDKVELYVTEGGNMAGVTIFNGSKDNFDYRFIFPSIEVEQGDYIVVRESTEKFFNQYTETSDLDIPIDKKFIDGVRDIRTDNFKLSSTNGAIGIYTNPYGEILDAVVYSKNYNDESKNNRNFGLSKTMNRIDEISESGGWEGTFELIFPDDSIYVGDSTTTRSLNRNNFRDSNTNDDWYTVGTGGSTFGFENSTDEY